MLGFVINTGKGFYDSRKLRKKEKNLDLELRKDLFDGLDEDEIFEYTSKLILAESFQNLEKTRSIKKKFKILEEALFTMKSEITKAEESLKKMKASKLDIATLAVNIQDLTLNTLKENENILNSTKKIIQTQTENGNDIRNNKSNIVKVRDEIKKLGNKSKIISDKLTSLSNSFENAEKEIDTLKKKHKINSDQIDQLKISFEESKTEFIESINSVSSQVDETNTILSKNKKVGSVWLSILSILMIVSLILIAL